MSLSARQVTAYQARLNVAQGDLAAADSWAQRLEAARRATLEEEWPESIQVMIDAVEETTLARLCLAHHKHAEAATIIERLLGQTSVAGWTGLRLEALALLALALDGQGDRDRALEVLRASLELAEPEGYARIYLDEGPPMAALLRRALGAGCGAPSAHDGSQQAATSGVEAAGGLHLAAPSAATGLQAQRASAISAYVARLLAAFPAGREASAGGRDGGLGSGRHAGDGTPLFAGVAAAGEAPMRKQPDKLIEPLSARDRGAGPAGARSLEPRDRLATHRHGGHRQAARQQHLWQAGRDQPGRGDRPSSRPVAGQLIRLRRVLVPVEMTRAVYPFFQPPDSPPGYMTLHPVDVYDR